MTDTLATPRRDERFWSRVLLTLILVSSFLIKLNHLGHGAIRPLDESFHAVVAKNLIKHPLTPTLVDQPYLPYDYRDWQNNHVWLHKPIVPLWQMAASMAIFGVNTLALRLPSALLATAAVWLTYAIGVQLLNRRVALIAAGLQAFNAPITALVQGYVFSDHIDIAFLFYVELAVYCLCRAIGSGSSKWMIACGVAQGFAFLSKTYPAFVVTGIALVLMLLPLPRRLTSASSVEPRRRELIVLIAATLATIAPWTIWCLIQFPREFAYEQLQVFRHLGENVEQWAAPWDRLIFDYSLRIYGFFYPLIIAASIILAWRAWKERNTGLVICLAWGFGVLVPFALAASKTPTATLIGWPPFFLLVGELIIRACRGDAMCLGAWFGAATLAMFYPGRIPRSGWGYPNPPQFARIMRENIWVLWHALAALGMGLGLRAALSRKRLVGVTVPLAIIAGACSAVIAARMSWETYGVSRLNRQQPSFEQLGALIRTRTPANSVLLLEILDPQKQKGEHVIAMFHTDRTVYPVSATSWPDLAAKVSAGGGLPLLVSNRALPLPRVFDEPVDGLTVYAIGGE